MSAPRIALVTGASRRIGIGAAVCRALAAQGVDVAFTHWQAYDRSTPAGADEKGPPALQAELRGLGVRALAIEADLADPAAPPRLLDRVASQLGPVSILVSNAAHSFAAGYEALDAGALDAHYAVNVRGTALLCVEFARRFALARGGRIVNLTSGQSVGPMPQELAYAASKGAVEAFTLSLAAGVAHRGITVNAVDPGPTDTGWMSPEVERSLAALSPHGRVGRPEDAARLIAFLASEQAEWITGQVLHSRGGFGWA